MVATRRGVDNKEGRRSVVVLHIRGRDAVRFTPESGHVQCKPSCPLWANSGHESTLSLRCRLVLGDSEVSANVHQFRALQCFQGLFTASVVRTSQCEASFVLYSGLSVDLFAQRSRAPTIQTHLVRAEFLPSTRLSSIGLAVCNISRRCRSEIMRWLSPSMMGRSRPIRMPFSTRSPRSA
jgi:hypothetical protein